MGTGTSGNDGTSLFLAATGAIFVFRIYREIQTRVVQPGGQDPARPLKWLLICGVPVLAIGIVVANVIAFKAFGVDALILAILLDVIGLIGLTCLAGALWTAAELQRRQTGYVISEHSYLAAPRSVKSSMRRVHKSARTVRGGRAHQAGMFGDFELDQVVYEAAQQAVVSAELTTAVDELQGAATTEDAEALKAAAGQLDEILHYLQDVDASLKRAASTASKLSEDIARPAQERVARKLAADAAAAKAKRREQARARLDDVAVRAAARPVANGGDVEDRVTAVHAGYTEARSVSDAVLHGRPAIPQEQKAESTAAAEEDRHRAAREAVWKATKLSAGKAGKFSVAAAKAGSEKIRNRIKDD